MKKTIYGAVLLGSVLCPLFAHASSHREAPDIAGRPRVDGTDFYMFRSYEPGRSEYVTFIANYIPFQDPQGGPNFYNMDQSAVYRINIDNTGSAKPALVFEFKFTNEVKDLAVESGGKKVAVPLINIGPVTAAARNLNVVQSYTVRLIRDGDYEKSQLLENRALSSTTFYKPADDIGKKSIADYPSYAGQFVYETAIPGCATPGAFSLASAKKVSSSISARSSIW